MKVSYIHGICVKNDAISNSIRDEIIWLCSEGHDVHLYAYACDYEGLSFIKVNAVRDAAFDDHFQSSDLVVFHFGIYYSLFDLLFATPKNAKRLVVFHNITPKEFVPAELHPTNDKSFKQLANVALADHVVCDSQTNLDVLRASGINVPATILPLAVHSKFHMPEAKPSAIDGVVRLAFVGRFVRSKGPGELLDALDGLLQRNPTIQVTLDMVGNLFFSDSTLLDDIQKTVDAIHLSHGARVNIAIHGNANEEAKNKILQESDLFILPTYHEGFCVPILEAFANGCRVIAYDNSNVPAISGGLANLVVTGEVEALSNTMSEVVEEILSSAWHGKGAESYEEYCKIAETYLHTYSPENTKRRFLNFIKSFTF